MDYEYFYDACESDIFFLSLALPISLHVYACCNCFCSIWSFYLSYKRSECAVPLRHFQYHWKYDIKYEFILLVLLSQWKCFSFRHLICVTNEELCSTFVHQWFLARQPPLQWKLLTLLPYLELHQKKTLGSCCPYPFVFKFILQFHPLWAHCYGVCMIQQCNMLHISMNF